MEKSDTLDELLVKHGASKTFQQKDFLKELPATLALASGKSGTSKEAAPLVRQKWIKQGEAIKEIFTLSQQDTYRAAIVALGGLETLSLVFESLEVKLGDVGADIMEVESEESMHARLKIMRFDEAQRQQRQDVVDRNQKQAT